MGAQTGSKHTISSALRAWVTLALVLSFLPVTPASPASAAPSSASGGQGVRIAQPSTLAAGGDHMLEVRSDGTLWGWGFNGRGQVGVGHSGSTLDGPTRVGTDSDWVAVAAGWEHSLGLKADGTLWAWGNNANGRLGLGDTTNRTAPTQVGIDTDWAYIAAGTVHSAAIKSDGSLYTWGVGSFGRLGLGNTSIYSTPQLVTSGADWVAVECGSMHTVALKADGSVWTTGRGLYGMLGHGDEADKTTLTKVGAARDWSSISAGTLSTLALKSDGTIWAWGHNPYEELGVEGGGVSVLSPAQVGSRDTWRAIAAGAKHRLALDADGSVWSWGTNSHHSYDYVTGQLGIVGFGPIDRATTPTLIPGVTTPATGLVAGYSMSGATTTGGELWLWGQNSDGQLGIPGNTHQYVPTRSFAPADWVEVAEGMKHMLGVRADGTLWATGANDDGRLGVGYTGGSISWLQQVGTDTDWATVSAQEYHSLGLKTDGTLWAWGANINGQLGLGDTDLRNAPTQVGVDSDWVAMRAGYDCSYAIKSDGTLWAWGSNMSGRLGLGDTDPRLTPVQVAGEGWRQVSALYDTAYAVKDDGTLWAWGVGADGRLGLGADSSTRLAPEQVGESADWEQVSAGYGYAVAVKNDGTLWGWGRASGGQLGLGDAVAGSYNTPQQLPGQGWISAEASEGFTHAIAGDGSLWGWGWNGYGQVGDGTTDTQMDQVRIGSANDWVSMSSHFYSAHAIRADGTLWAWGYDNYTSGVFGDRTTGRQYLTPVPISAGSGLARGNGPVAVTAGDYFSVVVKADGTLWSWGNGSLGRLGTGGTANEFYPVQVGGDDDWVAVDSGATTTAALKADGTLWTWGGGDDGRLGQGDTDGRLVPTQVGSDSDWVAVSMGTQHGVAIRADGTLWAWGKNEYGQLGTSNYVDSLVPVQVGSSREWASVSAGRAHTLAIKADGTLWAWGYNVNSELGIDVDPDTNVPTQVGTDVDWTAVSTGLQHTAALKADGTLWTWGWNSLGQLGHGDDVQRTEPTAIVGYDGWVAVEVGTYHTLAMAVDGALYGWGSNSYGQVADGAGTSVLSPTEIATGTPGPVALAVGERHSLALAPDGTLRAWGNALWGQLGLGDQVQTGVPTLTFAPGDTHAPVVLAVRSDTHPLESVQYEVSTLGADLFAADTGSWVAGYSWVVDTVADTVPDGVIDSRGSAVSITAELTPGMTNYLHVRAVDAAGNAGAVVRRAIVVSGQPNTAPVAVDDAYSTPFETALVVSAGEGVLDNDTDAEGDELSVDLGQTVYNGTLGLNTETGAFTYEPDAGFSGVDTFTYRAFDGAAYSDEATVSITVHPPVIPIAGNTRYETAVKASEHAYPDGLAPDGKRTVIIATGMNWPDALGGTSLAGALDGPVLLVKPTSVPDEVMKEIRRLKATKAIILGGRSAVSAGVEQALKTELGTGAGIVRRIDGANRYETADKIAKEVIATRGTSYDGYAFVATGGNFPDALAAAPLAAAKGWPLYLADPKTGLSAESKTAMTGVTDVVILGGTGAVSAPIKTYLDTRFVTGKVLRLEGKNRYQTAAKIAKYAVDTHGHTWNLVGITTGENFPDALAGGVVQGKAGSVMLLTTPKVLQADTKNTLVANKSDITSVTFFGGTGAVSQTVRDAVAQALQ